MAFLISTDASVFNESGRSVEAALTLNEQRVITNTNNKAIDFNGKTHRAYLSYISPYLKFVLLWERQLVGDERNLT